MFVKRLLIIACAVMMAAMPVQAASKSWTVEISSSVPKEVADMNKSATQNMPESVKKDLGKYCSGLSISAIDKMPKEAGKAAFWVNNGAVYARMDSSKVLIYEPIGVTKEGYTVFNKISQEGEWLSSKYTGKDMSEISGFIEDNLMDILIHCPTIIKYLSSVFS